MKSETTTSIVVTKKKNLYLFIAVLSDTFCPLHIFDVNQAENLKVKPKLTCQIFSEQVSSVKISSFSNKIKIFTARFLDFVAN